MKKTTFFLSLLFVGVFATTASAKIWRVNNALMVPSQVDFNELTDAVSSAMVVAGDTIYVEGSAQEYEGGVMIHKQVTIIGPGYLLDQGNVQPTSCNQLPAVIGSGGITFGVGSDGTYISGMTIYLNPNSVSVIFQKTSNITFTRNNTANIRFAVGVANDVNYCQNITITRNLICGRIEFSSYSTTNTILIANNLIRDDITINPNSNFSIVLNGTIIYNLFNHLGRINVMGCEIAYNYVESIESDTDNISIHDNILHNNSTDNQAIVADDPSNVIDPYDDNAFNCDSDNWTLPVADQSPLHGAYNGFDPYYSDNAISPANLPAIPVIYNCRVQACGDETIDFEADVRTNN